MEKNSIDKLIKDYPMLNYFNNERTFGVEIEFRGLQYNKIPPLGNIIMPSLISSRAKDGRHFFDLCDEHKIKLGVDKESWHFEEDTSVTGRLYAQYGVELISPILKGIKGLIEVYNALEFINNIKDVSIDETCGFHVHHGVDTELYKCPQLKELVTIIYPIEDFIYLLIPGQRKDNETCAPIQIDVETFLENCLGDCKKCKYDIKELWDSQVEKTRNSGGRYDPTRYHGLNLYSYWYRGTIEFRYHSGVLDYVDEAMQWIIFSQFLIELSTLSAENVPEIKYMKNRNKWMDLIYQIYWNLGHQDKIIKPKNFITQFFNYFFK